MEGDIIANKTMFGIGGVWINSEVLEKNLTITSSYLDGPLKMLVRQKSVINSYCLFFKFRGNTLCLALLIPFLLNSTLR